MKFLSTAALTMARRLPNFAAPPAIIVDHIVAFEPDPENFVALQCTVNGHPRNLQPCATGSRRKRVCFAVGGTSARISSAGPAKFRLMRSTRPLTVSHPHI